MKRQSMMGLWLAAVVSAALMLVPPMARGQGGFHHDDWIEIEGAITALDANAKSLTVGTTEIFVGSQTVILGEEHRLLTFADLQVGWQVEVKAMRQADGTLLALFIEVKGHMDHHWGVEVKGTIEAKGESSITVAGLTFQVTAQTIILGEEHRLLTFADLQVGQRVEVKGLRLPEGTLVALMIKVEEEEEETEVEVEGFIDAVTDTSITVGGITFTIDSNTVIEGLFHQPLTVDDLSVGQRVEVKGEVQADGSLLALRIKVKFTLPELPDVVEVTGVIDSIGSDHIVVLGLTFFVDANTVILDDDRHPISLTDLHEGQTVEVKAVRRPDGTFLALRIKREDLRAMQVEVRGNIESIDRENQTVTVLGLTFRVTAETRIVGAHRAVLSFAELELGMRVEIHGVQQSMGSLWATRIVVLQPLGAEIEIEGLITDINGTDGTIVVAGITIHVDAHTVILLEHHRLGTFADLKVDQRVKVKAQRQPDGSLLAVRIKIDEDLSHGMEMSGEVGGISGNSIIVAGMEFVITSNTVVLDSDYHVISASQLSAGQTVYIWGEQQPGQSPTAVQIQQVGGQVTSAGDSKPQTVTTYALHQNYPNPFNPSTTIRFEIPASVGASDVELTIYNLMGQKIRTLVNAKMAAGSYTVRWDGRDDRGVKAASGIYFYRLQAGSFTAMRRMVLTK